MTKSKASARGNYSRTRPASGFRFKVVEAGSGRALGVVVVSPGEIPAGSTAQRVANQAIAEYPCNAFAVPG